MQLPSRFCLAVLLSCAGTVVSFSLGPIRSPKVAATQASALAEKSDAATSKFIPKDFFSNFASVSIGTAMLASSLMLAPILTDSTAPAHAEGSKVVGSLKGSGLVFKDTLNIERFEDPKVKGVTLYISNFDRPITEKLNGGFFNDPSSASVTCAKTGPVSVADNIATSVQGEEVFEESRSLLFKTLRVQRIYDKEKNTVVYVNFATRIDKTDDANSSRFKSSLCAVNLD